MKIEAPFSKLVCLICLLQPMGMSFADTQVPLRIEVDKPVFVLPQFTGPFREREASIAPEEYETAERLRQLLDSEDKQAVLDELSEFYDIELSVAMLTLKAQIYFSLEIFEKAEKTYKAVLARKPQLVRAHADLAQLYLLTERPVLARQHFANAVSYGANEAMIHGQLGYLNLTQHGAYTAITEYQQALAIEPDNIQWQQGLLAALSQAKMHEAAKAMIVEMLAKKPDNADLWLNRAAIELEVDEPQAALAALEMAILLGNDNHNNLKTAAQLHLQLNSYERAVELIQRDFSDGDIEMATLNQYLSWLGQAGMWQPAEKMLGSLQSRLSAMTDEEKSIYFLHRARHASAGGAMDRAKSYFEEAVKWDPTNGPALIDYARHAMNQKMYSKSDVLYMRAEGVRSVEKQAVLGKAQLYIEMQDYRAALNQLRKAYTKYPDMIALKDNIDIVENILRSKEST